MIWYEILTELILIISKILEAIIIHQLKETEMLYYDNLSREI